MKGLLALSFALAIFAPGARAESIQRLASGAALPDGGGRHTRSARRAEARRSGASRRHWDDRDR